MPRCLGADIRSALFKTITHGSDSAIDLVPHAACRIAERQHHTHTADQRVIIGIAVIPGHDTGARLASHPEAQLERPHVITSTALAGDAGVLSFSCPDSKL